MTMLYLWAKKNHRFLVPIVIFLSLIMLTTGVMMKYEQALQKFSSINFTLVRSFHSNTSTYFSIVLTAMLITGTYMYIYPWLQRKKQKATTQNDNNPAT